MWSMEAGLGCYLVLRIERLAMKGGEEMFEGGDVDFNWLEWTGNKQSDICMLAIRYKCLRRTLDDKANSSFVDHMYQV